MSFVSNILFFIGIFIIVFLLVYIKSSFKKNNILMHHMREIFTFVNYISFFSSKYRILYISLVTVVFISIIGSIVYKVEVEHRKIYDSNYTVQKGKKEIYNMEPMEFKIWIARYAASGESQDIFPKTYLGVFLILLLPLVAIAFAIYLIRTITDKKTISEMLENLAKGILPEYRVVIYNYQPKADELLHNILKYKKAFVVIFLDKYNIGLNKKNLENYITNNNLQHKIYIADENKDIVELYDKYNILDVSEIYMFASSQKSLRHNSFKILSQLDYDIVNKYSKYINTENENAISHLIPKIVIEGDELYMRSFIDKLKSKNLKENIFETSSIKGNLQYLISNLDNTTESINEYFKLKSFDKITLDKRLSIRFSINNGNLDELKNYIKNGKTLFGYSLKDNKILYNEAIENNIGDKIYGITAKIGNELAIMDIPSTIIADQVTTLSGVIIKDKNSNSYKFEKKEFRGRVIIYNFNYQIDDFINLINKNFKISSEQIIFINPVNLLSDESRYKIMSHVELKDSDRIFILNSYQDNGEYTQIKDIENVSKSYNNNNILILVECINVYNRTFFEHLAVDKIYDSYQLQESYFKLFSFLYYGQLYIEKENGFYLASHIAKIFKKFICIHSSEKNIEKGKHLENFIGKKYIDIVQGHEKFVKYKQLQFLYAFNINYNKGKVEIKYIDTQKKQLVGKDDYLVFLPLL